MATTDERASLGLASLLGAAGVTHFLAPRAYDQLIPGFIPGRARAWTLGSGVVEIAVGSLVARRSTRRLGAALAAGLFVAVFPGNIKMAVDWSDRSVAAQAVAYSRLPLQVPLVLWALRVARAAG
jgi:uncharacterized membrane protein